MAVESVRGAGETSPPSDRPRPSTTLAVDMLHLADRTVQACLEHVTASARLSREQWRMLMLLDRGEGDVEPLGRTMGELADASGMPPASATRTVDRLVDEGLATRSHDRWDRRRVLVECSPRGHELLARAAIELDEVFGTVLSDLTPTDRVDLLGMLERLSGALERDGRQRPGWRSV